jgi:chemotaxis signal transduction protein
MTSSNILSQDLRLKERANDTLELILFEIGAANFGIPISKIVRVINHLFLGEDYSGDRDVEIVDLHDLLFGRDISNPNAMVIYIDDRQQLHGIPIEMIPSLISIPFDRIRTLPPEFRTSTPLSIASHIAIGIQEDGTEITVFIMS